MYDEKPSFFRFFKLLLDFIRSISALPLFDVFVFRAPLVDLACHSQQTEWSTD